MFKVQPPKRQLITRVGTPEAAVSGCGAAEPGAGAEHPAGQASSCPGWPGPGLRSPGVSMGWDLALLTPLEFREAQDPSFQ